MLYALLTGPALPEASAKSFFAQMQKKRITLLTTTLRTRPREYKQQLVARFSREVLPKLAAGSMHHVIDKEFAGLAHAQAAHDYMESNANSGKIVLTVQ